MDKISKFLNKLSQKELTVVKDVLEKIKKAETANKVYFQESGRIQKIRARYWGHKRIYRFDFKDLVAPCCIWGELLKKYCCANIILL